MSEDFVKYPRTYHMEGSLGRAVGEDVVPFTEVRGKYLVVEEKMDGTQVGVSFSREGRMLLQSRGTPLNGGGAQFSLLLSWANEHYSALLDILGSRYIMFGEWLYAKHTVFYDLLPNYFLEFDVYDKEENCFLSTELRHILFSGSHVSSVRVVKAGSFTDLSALTALVGPSSFQSSAWKENLLDSALKADIPKDVVLRETDSTGLMEGLYIKVEDSSNVLARYKLIRSSFLATLLDSVTHWSKRKVLRNIQI